jgi:ferritin-like metal-binding protein YciE
MSQQTPIEAICRYLEDAIAAENSFEHQLRQFANEVEQPELKQLFEHHADETKLQEQRLITRLEALGGKPSGVKGFVATVLSLTPKMAQLGHDRSELGTQDLMMAFAAENSEIAMYEALAISASVCGDLETEQLARDIQDEERLMADKIWNHLAPCARRSFEKVTAAEPLRQAA